MEILQISSKNKHFALKVFLSAALFCVLGVASLSAQQITRFAVVDTAKIYNAYFRQSSPVRNYEKKKADFQAEVNRYTDELQKLQQKKLDYEKNDNDAGAQKIAAQIAKKKEFLIEYTNAKNIELESMQKSLSGSDDFYKKLYSTLAKVAETGGYSAILSLQQENAILWYSPSVDVTNQVISELGL